MNMKLPYRANLKVLVYEISDRVLGMHLKVLKDSRKFIIVK